MINITSIMICKHIYELTNSLNAEIINIIHFTIIFENKQHLSKEW